MHTYPYHNSHYNPNFWKTAQNENGLSDIAKVDAAMNRALEFSKEQYNAVKKYVNSISPEKTVHIGETGWASSSDGHYGIEGSRASDEYKQALFYDAMRKWTNKNGISCFYFEAFDEIWKDKNPKGSENHFGLLTVDRKAKFAIWNEIDNGVLKSLTRDGKEISKTFNGNKEELMKSVLTPPNH